MMLLSSCHYHVPIKVNPLALCSWRGNLVHRAAKPSDSSLRRQPT
jgi:hypothetical protein